MKEYEALFIFPTSLSEEEINEALARIEAEITKLNGTQTHVDILGRRTFARPMKKAYAGQYVKLQLELVPETISPLLERLKFIDAIYRTQITVKVQRPAPTKAPAAAE